MKKNSGANLSPGFIRLMPVLIALNVVSGVRQIYSSFHISILYGKDFIQEYLMAKAILNGVSPYLPLPKLIGKWIGYTNFGLLHPTPHPPILGLLSVPLGFLSYETAAIVWLIFQVLCLSASIILLHRLWKVPLNPRSLAIAFGIALGSLPFIEDLCLGQFSICLLLLLIGAWQALRSGKDALGGALLGAMIALKLSAWPLAIFLAGRRRWKAVVSAAAVMGAANLLSLSVLGLSEIWEYYLHVGPRVSAIYRLHELNFSAWTLGQKFFLGFGKDFLVPPLWESPALARTLLILAPVAILLLGLLLALKAKNFDTSFGLMVIIGIFVNPIAWSHYLVLASVPMTIVAYRLYRAGFPKFQSYGLIGIWFLFSSACGTYIRVEKLFSGKTTADGIPILPFTAGLLTLIPALGLAGLLWMLWRSDQAGEILEAAECDLPKSNDEVTASAEDSVYGIRNDPLGES